MTCITEEVTDLKNRVTNLETEIVDVLTGPQGAPGVDGSDGASAYEVAVAEGFVGTEAEWLASLVGPQGPVGSLGDVYDVDGNLVLPPANVSYTNDNAILIGVENATAYPGLGAGLVNANKPIFIGPYAGQYSEGYLPIAVGWKARRHSVSLGGIGIGTHAGESTNKKNRIVYGFGATATGDIGGTAIVDGDQWGINNVLLTARAAAPGAGEFLIGGTMAESFKNFIIALAATGNNLLAGICFRIADDNSKILVTVAGPGTWGNSVTLHAIGTDLTRSGEFLTGGTDQMTDGNPDNYPGLVGIGIAAVKRGDPAFMNRGMGGFIFAGNPAAGDRIRVGIGSVGTSNPTAKRYKYVASGAAAIQINLGATREETMYNTVVTLNSDTAYTQVNACTYWVTTKGIFIRADAVTANNWKWRTEAESAQITARSRYLRRCWGVRVDGPMQIGNNGEAIIGGDFVMFGNAAGRVGTLTSSALFGSTTGSSAISHMSFYANGGGKSLWGDYNCIIGPVTGTFSGVGHTVASISADGMITLATPFNDPRLFIGDRVQLLQTTTTAGNLIKQNGSNVAANGLFATIVSPWKLKCVNFLDDTDDGDSYIWSISGAPSDITLTTSGVACSESTSFGERPVDGEFGLGLTTQDMVTIYPRRLNLPQGIMTWAATNVGTVTLPEGSITFNAVATEGGTYTIGGIVFTAAAAPNGSRKFKFGADAYDSAYALRNAIEAARFDPAGAALRNIRTYVKRVGTAWVVGIVYEASTDASAFAITTTDASAVAVSPTGGAFASLPTVDSNVPPKNNDLMLVTSWQGTPAWIRYLSANQSWNKVGL